MKAIYLTRYGNSHNSFETRETQKPACKTGEVLIEVECFGLNYAEVMARQGLYRAAPPLPCVLGYEVVGKVIEVFDEADKVLIGKRVVAFTRFGGYAQLVKTPSNAVVEIGDMSGETACALAVQYVTAYYMSHLSCSIQPGEKIMVHAGAGGVGTALIQLCKLKQAYVIANASSEEKLNYMKSQGADEVINYSNQDYFKILQQKNIKPDVIFNPIAGSTFKKDYSLLNTGGRLFIFGASERSGKKFGIFSTLNLLFKMGSIRPIFLLGKSKALIGVNMLTIADDKPEILSKCLKEVVALLKEGKINPHVGKVFKANEIADAHQFLESRKSIGKIVVSWK